MTENTVTHGGRAVRSTEMLDEDGNAVTMFEVQGQWFDTMQEATDAIDDLNRQFREAVNV